MVKLSLSAAKRSSAAVRNPVIPRCPKKPKAKANTDMTLLAVIQPLSCVTMRQLVPERSVLFSRPYPTEIELSTGSPVFPSGCFPLSMLESGRVEVSCVCYPAMDQRVF
jgi:hypothetical protein